MGSVATRFNHIRQGVVVLGYIVLPAQGTEVGNDETTLRLYLDDLALILVSPSLVFALPDDGAAWLPVGFHFGSEHIPLDLGRVGTVSWVNRDLITNTCKADRVPVIPSLAYDEAGNWLNINADTAASAVAVHLQAEKFVLMTDTAGILQQPDNPQSLLTHLDRSAIENLVQSKVIDAGMLPKVEACLDALRAGVKKTHIIDGRLRHSLLLEIYTDVGVGTEIVL